MMKANEFIEKIQNKKVSAFNEILKQDFIPFEIEKVLSTFDANGEQNELKNEILEKIKNQRNILFGKDAIRVFKDYYSPVLWLNGIGYDFGKTFNLSQKLQNDLRKWSDIFDGDMGILDYEVYGECFEEVYNDEHDEPLTKKRLKEIKLKYEWCQKQNLNLARAVKRELGDKYIVATLNNIIYELRLGVGLLKDEKNETILLNELCEKLEITQNLELERDLYLWAKDIRSGNFGNIEFPYKNSIDERDERGKKLARRIEKLLGLNYIVRYEPLKNFGEEYEI